MTIVPQVHHQAAMPLQARRADDADDALSADDGPMHRLCEAWADWCRAGAVPGITAGLVSPAAVHDHPRRRSADADVPPVARIVSFHLAVISQPGALDRHVFELHYLQGSRNIKAAAARLGISRPHWYRLVNDFRRRVFDAMQAIERQTQAYKKLADETSLCLTN